MTIQDSIAQLRNKLKSNIPLDLQEQNLLMSVVETWEEQWGPLRMKTSDGRVTTAKDLLYEEMLVKIKKYTKDLKKE